MKKTVFGIVIGVVCVGFASLCYLGGTAYGNPPRNLRIYPGFYESKVLLPAVTDIQKIHGVNELEAVIVFEINRSASDRISKTSKDEVQEQIKRFLSWSHETFKEPWATHADQIEVVMKKHRVELQSAILIHILRASENTEWSEATVEKLVELLNAVDRTLKAAEGV